MPLLNLHDLSDKLDGVIVPLSQYSENDELQAAIDCILEAKEYLRLYSRRLIEDTEKSWYKGRYDDFFDNHEFDDAQEIWNDLYGDD